LQNVRNVEVVLNATAPVFAALQVGSATVVYRGTPKNVEAVRALANSWAAFVDPALAPVCARSGEARRRIAIAVKSLRISSHLPAVRFAR